MPDLMEYKGYHGTIEYSAEDALLIGSVIGVRDSLNYHGVSIPEITQSFHDCVDGYLEMCREFGKSPDKEYKGSFNVRIDPELHRSADIEARKLGISLNQYVQDAIQAKVSSKHVQLAQIIIDGVQIRTAPISDGAFNKALYKEPIPFRSAWKGAS